MAKFLFVGCDLHEKEMLLVYAGDDGDVKRCRFRSERRWRKGLVRWLQHEAERVGAREVVFAYEASSAGFILYDDLIAAGVKCHVVAPTKLDRSPHHRRRKSDANDARVILDVLRAAYLAGAQLPGVWVPDRMTREAREVVRGRLRTAQKVAATKNEITSLLKRFGVERPRGVGCPWTKSFRQWVEGLVDCQGPLGPWVGATLGSLLSQLKMLEAEIEHFDSLIKALSHTERYEATSKALDEVKGVGLLVAMTFLVELGDLARFSNRRQVASYLGLVPSCYESGEADDRKGHITRQGPGRVRGVLSQAAWAWVRWDERARRKYDRLVARNPKKRKIALVAMMRQLAVVLWRRGLKAQRRAAARSKNT